MSKSKQLESELATLQWLQPPKLAVPMHKNRNGPRNTSKKSYSVELSQSIQNFSTKHSTLTVFPDHGGRMDVKIEELNKLELHDGIKVIFAEIVHSIITIASYEPMLARSKQ
jgi:hypothetical protein